ncbi:MAG: UbiD family decarboxylase [Chloroflexi bacterium]|nr:UbiD family decarboxylase [Chloroflexota bacterium]
MPYDDLQSFLRALELAGDLRRVKVAVDPELEITEIVTRTVRSEGPALLFENVAGSRYPLAINILGSQRRIEMALGMHPEELGESILRLVERMNPPSLRALWSERSTLRRLMKIRPSVRRRALGQQVVEKSPDLLEMPVLKCWPDDGGRFITLGLCISRDPVNGKGNMGVYRMHVYDGRTTGMHMQIQKGGGFHHYSAERLGRPLEMAVALGSDPALTIAAVMALPEGIDEVAFSGVLRGKRTPVARAKTLGLRVPANAEFVLEGVVLPNARRSEGPFGDHFGHYSDVSDFPVFEVRAITHRRNPVYPAAVVGRPPQEDRYIGDATQLALRPLARLTHPELRDMWAYYESGFHHLLVASVQTRYTREPYKTAMGLLGEGQLSLTKCLVLVNEDVDPRDPSAVLREIGRNFDPREDFLLIARTAADTLDFTGEKLHHGSKMVIDATGQGQANGGPVDVPDVDLRGIVPDAAKWRLAGGTLLVVQTRDRGREAVQRLVASHELPGVHALRGVKAVVAVSQDVDIEDDVDLIWGMFTRFDPARDVVFTKAEFRGAAPVYSGLMGIDATFKPGYPAPLVMSPEVVEKVDRRWDEYWK